MEKIYDNEITNIAAKLDEAQGYKLAQTVARRWKGATDELSGVFSNSVTAWDFYLNNRTSSKTGTRMPLKRDKEAEVRDANEGHVRLGYIPKVVDSILAKQHTSTFPADERFFRGRPLNQFSVDNQEDYEVSLLSRFSKKNIVQHFLKFRMLQFIDGIAAMHVKHATEKEKKVVYERPEWDLLGFKLALPGKIKSTKKEVVTYDGADCEVLSLNEWRVDPKAKNVQDSWFCRRWYKPVHEIKRMFPKFPKEDIKPYDKNWEDMSDEIERTKYIAMGITDASTRSIEKASENYGLQDALLMICYGDFYVGEELYENHVAVVLNDCKILYFGANPYNHGKIPYIVSSYMDIPNHIYSPSLVHHAIPSAEYIDKFHRSLLTNAAWASNPIFGKLFNDPVMRVHKDKPIVPGTTIPMGTQNALFQIPVNVSNLSWSDSIIKGLADNINDVTGANTYVQGNTPEFSRVSAFEVDARVQGGETKSQISQSCFNNTVLEPFMYMCMENDKQFLESDLKVYNKTMNRDDVKLLDFEFTITSLEATLSRAKRAAQLKSWVTEIVPMLLQSGLASVDQKSAAQINIPDTLKKLLRENGFADSDDLITIVSKEQQVQENMMQQQTPPAIPPELSGEMNVLPQSNPAPTGNQSSISG